MDPVRLPPAADRLAELVAATRAWIELPRSITGQRMQAAIDEAGTDGDAGRLAAEIRAYQAGQGGPHGTGRFGPGAAARILTRHGYPSANPIEDLLVVPAGAADEVRLVLPARPGGHGTPRTARDRPSRVGWRPQASTSTPSSDRARS